MRTGNRAGKTLGTVSRDFLLPVFFHGFVLLQLPMRTFIFFPLKLLKQMCNLRFLTCANDTTDKPSPVSLIPVTNGLYSVTDVGRQCQQLSKRVFDTGQQLFKR
jgi:hypothetical protein